MASDLDRNFVFAQFQVALLAVPILARAINCRFLITTDHLTRLFMTSCLAVLAYMCLHMATNCTKDVDAFYYAILACLLQQFAQSLGESILLGYCKAIPQELVVSFCSGIGISPFFGIFTTLVMTEFGVEEG